MLTLQRARHIDILRSIAIILVVIGHVGGIPGMERVENRFIIYSYHLALFFFISGYLFRDMEWKDYGRFVWRKTKKLALPLIAWNIVYAAIVYLISVLCDISYLPKPASIWCFHNLFIEPFVSGHQYILNSASWFVGTLFLTMICYGAIHILTRRIPDWIGLIFYALLAAACLFSARFTSDNYWLIPQRMGYALFFVQAGRCFRLYLEPLLTPKRLGYALIVALILWWAVLTCEWRCYVLVFMNFEGYVLRPLAAGLMGCLFWIIVSLFLVAHTSPNRIEQWIGSNTWSIMMHHLLVRFILVAVAVWFSHDVSQVEAFKSDFWFRSPMIDYWGYVAAMIIIPILWQSLFNRFKSRFSR